MNKIPPSVTDNGHPEPLPGFRRPSLHVMQREGRESFVWWSRGKWTFWLGHERCDRRSPEESGAFGWRYIRPAKIDENGAAS